MNMQEHHHSHLFWRNSLAGKFVTLTVVVVFILMVINAYINYRAQEDAIINNLKTQNTMLGNFMASIAPEVLLSYDFDALNEYMKEISAGEDVVYAAVFSTDGAALTTYLQRHNPMIANLLAKHSEVDVRVITEALQSSPRIIHQRFPILFENKMLGHFVIGTSTRRVEELTRRKLLGALLLSTLFTVLLGLGVYLVFRLNTMRPILQMVQGAHRIATGNLDKEVEVTTQDELGRLAMTFNQMMQQIKLSNGEKDALLGQLTDLNQSLEARVDQRTRELESASQKLEKLAMHDSLTNLPNRFCILQSLNSSIPDARRNGTLFSVIMMDLDRFKDINDTLGHDCGDQLLIEVGKRLQTVLRPTDIIGRLGGDEFAILLRDTGEAGACNVARKILSGLEPSFYLADMAFSIGASLGIACYPQHGATDSALLKAADVAMYHAKHNKLGYYVYNPVADSNSPDKLSMMAELRDAINDNTLELYYQPKVDLGLQQIVGVEALLRWQHKERGFIPPDEFIPMAEQSGLIRRLTSWVISTALQQLERWHRQGIRLSMSINLSMHNLQDPDFPDELAGLFEQTYVPNHYVIFEITESVIMSNPDYVMDVLFKLGRMKVSFSIDDFGTGYSSLSTLKKLPVHELKVDKSFVMDMADDPDDEAIVHSIIDMARTLGLRVTAEGVESAAVTQQLLRLGCDEIQGYYISRPLPADQLEPIVQNLQWPVELARTDNVGKTTKVTPIKHRQ